MTRASDNEFPSVLFDEQAGDPSTPASGFWRAYFKSDGMHVIDDAGSVTGPLGAGGGGGAPDDGEYVTYAANGTLSAERVVTAPASNGIIPVVKFKASDESVTNTTLQNDDDLTFAIGANEKWVVEYHLFAANAANTGDIKLLPSVPSGASVLYGGVGPILAAVGIESNTRSQMLTDGTTAVAFGVLLTSSTLANDITFHVYVNNGANAGNVVLQWAQNSTDGSNATVMKAGSYLVAYKVA